MTIISPVRPTWFLSVMLAMLISACSPSQNASNGVSIGDKIVPYGPSFGVEGMKSKDARILLAKAPAGSGLKPGDSAKISHSPESLRYAVAVHRCLKGSPPDSMVRATVRLAHRYDEQTHKEDLEKQAYIVEYRYVDDAITRNCQIP